MTLGCTEVITKPVDVAQVYQMLGKVFGLMRKSLRVPVLIGVEVAAEKYEKTLDCTNISEAGMFICADEPIPDKTIVFVKFALPFRDGQLELKAKVERTITLELHEAESGMGLKFLDISEQEKQELKLFVQQTMVGDMFWEHH